LILFLLDDYIVATLAQCMVLALWMLGTHVYDQFECFSRLGLISPTSGFGKTTLFKLLDQLASETKLSKNATPAAIYRRLEHRPRTTYLLDEAENQGLLVDRVLRAVLDGGYERGGSIDRAGEEFLIYFPCAYALRGEICDVPSAVLSRSHIINMQLGTPKKLFERNDPAFSVARELIAKWRATVSLNLDPEMPAPLCNPRNPRLADNCRPLISVADTFGPPYGEAARAALIELCASLPHPDSGVQVLQDIRTVSFDRISKKALVEALHETGHWDAWRGPSDHGKPHPLTTGELSRLLRRFGIRARTIWPIPRLRAVNLFRAIAARILNKRGPITVQKTTHRHIRAKS
jgi:hypothetical protein